MASFGLSNARAEASRKNGARSRGPKTPNGKARSAQNALKHGLRAQKHVVLPGEDAAAFEAHEAALMEELAPEGALQTVLARRIVAATWRLDRAERIEGELFAENHLEAGSLGLALIRDCRRGRAFETLVRYRSGTLAEFWRALRTLKALQVEPAVAPAEVPAPAPRLEAVASTARSRPIEIAEGRPHGNPIEPESRGDPGEFEAARPNQPPHPRAAHEAAAEPRPVPAATACLCHPNEPSERGRPVPPRPRSNTADLPRGPEAGRLRR